MQLGIDHLSARLAQHRPQELDGPRFAAVALVLRERKNGPEVLVIERATVDGDPWSGHLAFPGGRRDRQDPSLEATALRETQEELGLDLSTHGSRLGALDHVRAHRALQLSVAPFVYLLRNTPALTPSPREVARAFWVELLPLATGERPARYEMKTPTGKFAMPGYSVEGRVLWGMSYQVLLNLFRLTA